MDIQERLKVSTFLMNKAYDNMIATLKRCSEQIDRTIETSSKILENVKVITQ